MSGVPQIMCDREALLKPSCHDDHAKNVWAVDWKGRGLPHCSIYIIAPDAHWPCKIGISVNPRKRVSTLQTSHWKTLAIPRCFWAETVRDARLIEAKAHQMLKDDNCFLLGEWFDKSPEQAAEVVEFAALSVGAPLHDRITQPDIAADVIREMQDYTRQYSFTRHMMQFGDGSPREIDYTTGKPFRLRKRT